MEENREASKVDVLEGIFTLVKSGQGKKVGPSALIPAIKATTNTITNNAVEKVFIFKRRRKE